MSRVKHTTLVLTFDKMLFGQRQVTKLYQDFKKTVGAFYKEHLKNPHNFNSLLMMETVFCSSLHTA